MSTLWRQKMKTFFKYHDFDKDGFLQRADFEGIVSRLVKFYLRNPRGRNHEKAYVDVEMRRKLRQIFVEFLWGDLVAGGGNVGATRKVTLEELIENLSALIEDKEGLDLFKSSSREAAYHFFEVVDTNCDNLISPDEFRNFTDVFARVFGRTNDEKHAQRAFTNIDTNKDGFISKTEFVAAYEDFWVGVTEGVGTYILGDLI
ncbi:unnamed protein product [Owenia fusiformis]|uniref:Uncharacterized protein n=1 Tax=Owenia fusiformis TaxID=6347 RepID=A0A8J1XJW9_OWEFU|nr:unnamed protein product [Owenia fusiformis]